MGAEDYIEIVLRRKWFIITPFIVSVIGIIVAFRIIPPMYKSTTQILVEPQKVSESYVKPTITIDIKGRLDTISQQVMSRTRLESIIKEFDLFHSQRDKLTSDEIVELMRKNIEINVQGQASFIISYMGADPETVMHVTNRLASLFIEENLKVREQQAEGTTEFLDTQLQSLKAVLESLEAQIKVFKEKYVGELPAQLEANLRTLDRLQLELQTINDMLGSAEDRKIVLEKQLTESNETLTGGSRADSLEARLLASQTELSRLSSIYTDKYPDIIRIKNEIAEIEKQLEEGNSSEESSGIPLKPKVLRNNPMDKMTLATLTNVNSNIKNLKEKQKEITKRIDILQDRVERIPTREQQMTSLVRDYENTKYNYQNLLNKKLDSQIAENLEKRQKGEQFRILDPANLPLKPFNSDPKRIILLGLALGLGSGGGLAFLLEYMDASFRKDEEVYTVLGLPVLASVPKIRIGIH